MNIIVSGVVYFAAGIIILSFFNIEVTPLVAALGVGGLAVGLALQDTLGNVFAGIHIISDEPFRVRDVIEVKDEDIQGEVIDIGWRSTRIRTFKGNVVIVPNSKIANSTLTNFELPKQPMKVSVECGVDYGSDLEKVEQVSLGVARTIQKTVEGGIPDFEPILRFHTFGDSNIEFRVILEASCRGDSFVLAHEFMKELHRRFDEEGIEISWPVRKQYQLGKPPSKRVYTKRKKRKRKAVKTKRERRDEGEIGDE